MSVQLKPFPLNPVLQVQVYEPTVLVQVADRLQLFKVELLHSLISVQLTPFPVYPVLQVQV